MEHQPGDIVWAKMRGYPYWPAKVLPKCPRERQPSAAHVFVFFYGSHQVAWIPVKDICSFYKYKKRYRNVTHRLGFDEAVWEAEEDPDLSLSDAQPILLELEGRKIDKKDTKLTTPTQMSPEERPTVTPVRQSSLVGTSSTKSSTKGSVKRGKDHHTSPSPSPAAKRRKKENVLSSQPHTHSYGTRQNKDSGKIEDNGKETAVTGSMDVDALGSDGKNGSIGENMDTGSQNESNGDENGDIGVEVTQYNGDISDNGSDKLLPVKAKVVPITDLPAPPKPPEKKKRAKSPQQIVILPSMTIVEALKAYHYNLCASLLIDVTDSTLALKHLRDLINLQFTASDVQEVKELVDTLRKIRRLKSNSRIRSRAEELYNKIKSLCTKGEVWPNPKSLTKKGPKDKLMHQRPQAVVRKINQTAKENRERDVTGEDGS